MSQKRILEIARACHEANRIFCALDNDFSQPAWDEAPSWQRDSTIEGVDLFLKKPDVTPAEMHAQWLAFKIKSGWKHGPKKDTDKREHPNLLPFEKLSPQQRFKDYLFLVVCKTFVNVYE